jgi:KDO2-lipid IV(A) lauroyltransferase
MDLQNGCTFWSSKLYQILFIDTRFITYYTRYHKDNQHDVEKSKPIFVLFMPNQLEKFLNSSSGLTMAIFLARTAPPRLGYGLARLAARWISTRRDSELVKAVRANQWVVSGGQSGKEALDHAIQAVFLNSARSVYELYHYVQDPDSAAGDLFVFEPSVQAFIRRPEFSERGLVIAGLHMNNFDLALQWICRYWIKLLALTLPNPQAGRRLEYEIRKQTGMNLVPATVSGLRQAVRHLKQGGMLVTGIDRPDPQYQPRPRFFSRVACLPTHHISLALLAHVPVIVVASCLEPDGKCHIMASPPIEMDSFPDRNEELLYNAERVLAVAEGFIRQTPHQWSVSQPVWPEALNEVP